MDKFLNWRLFAHPANWLIIFLILYFCALLAKMIYSAAVHGQSPISFPVSVTLRSNNPNGA